MARIRRGQRPTPKPRQRAVRGERVIDSQVALRKGTGSAARGGSSGGSYWHIDVDGVRAGYIFINLIDDRELGSHPSIQIQLNTSMRGRGIGQIAYRMASEASGYDTVYAHMRKSNTGSRIAAEHAGFSALDLPSGSQLTMVWHRDDRGI